MGCGSSTSNHQSDKAAQYVVPGDVIPEVIKPPLKGLCVCVFVSVSVSVSVSVCVCVFGCVRAYVRMFVRVYCVCIVYTRQ